MSIDPTNAKDIAWREAARAREHKPHRPIIMSSIQSTGPIKDWMCGICLTTEYSCGSAAAPICYGGSRVD